MDLFSWLPILIFIYAVATVFNPDNKKPQNRRPPNNRPTYSPQETKPTRPNWREKFEELERELFPREVSTSQPPRPTSTSRYQTSSQEYGGEGTAGVEGFGTEGSSQYEEVFSTEGSWGIEGTGGVEGIAGTEGTFGNEGTVRGEGSIAMGKGSVKPERNPNSLSSRQRQQNGAVIPGMSENPLVQGIIWAEVLGKPRAHSKLAYKRRS